MDQDHQDQGASASGAADLFTADQLQSINDGMVMGDVWRAAKALGPEATKSDIGMGAFHVAAMRMGLMSRDSDVADFLDRVRQEDFANIQRGTDRDAPNGQGR